MIAAFGTQEVFSLYTEEPSNLPERLSRTNQCIVLKSHHGSAALDAWLESVQAVMFLSVRDPRDASISMSHRFNAPLKIAAGWLVNDCRRVVPLCARYPVLKYEERFFEHRATVDQIAKALDLEPNSTVTESIFDRYATGAVRRLAQKLTDDASAMDDVTQNSSRPYWGHPQRQMARTAWQYPARADASVRSVFGALGLLVVTKAMRPLKQLLAAPG